MYDMRAPDRRPGYNRPGRTFEEELNLRYLSPGAFTVLSPEENGSPPDPPPAPPQYRLSPNANVRRNKNQSFSIIAESSNYEPSRSPSPTGRVSPFRGRGFNSTGSRHASPTASPPPPPEDNRLSYQQNNNYINNRRKSNIPQLKRHNSSTVLSTETSSDSSPKHQRRITLLKPQLSRSLNNISPRVFNKPPAVPGGRRHGGLYSRNSSFSRLSPIIGSSPEPSSDSKSQSSPSRIPMSRSSPASRKHSPDNSHHGSANNLNNNNKHLSTSNMALLRSRSRVGAQTASRHASRNASRNPSREPSPSGKPPISPIKNYRNIQAKVNSFNAKSKSKVPNPKTSSQNVSSSNRVKPSDKNNTKASSNSKLSRTDSISSVSKSSSLAKRSTNNNTSKVHNNKTSNNSSTSANGTSGTTSISDSTKVAEKKVLKKTASTRSLTKKGTDSDSSSGTATSSTSPTKKVEPLPAITEMLPPATVLSTTTDTVTKPLKIEATIDTPLKTGASTTNILAKPIKETPMYMDEGRVLSAKSVSSAIERMNDTVLDAETLLKDHNMSKLSPAATAIISLSSEPPPTQSQIRALPSVETTTTVSSASTGGVSHVMIGNNGQSVNSSTVVVNSNGGVGGQVTNNINKLISPDDSFGAHVHYENSDLRSERTVLPQEVQPIKIMVQEKGQDLDVQSGNVRFPPTATNGTAQGAGAPPHTGEGDEQSEEVPISKCGRFMHKFKQKMSCGCCKRADKQDQIEEGDGTPKPGCFSCIKKKKLHDVEEIIISTADDVEGAKKTFLEKLKCCSCRRGNKVEDTTTGCCGRSKKKETWTERRDSILSAPVPLTARQRCKNFFKLLFCCGCCFGCKCCRKTPQAPKIDEASSRRASLLSKKKSLTPTVIPQEDPKNKLDSSLVEYTSTMKAAIPVLPVALAYICLICNIFAPGTGTVFSGLFCLCIGKPRFSQRDDPKSRMGSFIINIFIGAGQLFTVLFCLVGWGWSIWWGVIMIKVAKKYRKIKLLEARMEAQQEKEAGSRSKEGSQKRDVEKGRS